MTFEFTPTFGQTYRASFWVTLRYRAMWPIIVIFAGAAIVLLTSWDQDFELWPNMAVLFLVPIVLGFVPAVTALSVWQQRHKNRTVQGVRRYNFAEDAIHLSGPFFETRLAWDAVFRARQSREFFFIYISPRAAFFVPVEAMVLTGQLDAFRTLLTTKLAGKARLRPFAA